MSRLLKNSWTRGIRRRWQNFWLQRRHIGLILGNGVTISNTKLGRYNMICQGSTVSNSSLGDYSYLGVNCKVSRAEIGKYCSIGPNVVIGLGIHPAKDFVSTHPIFYSTTFRCENRFAKKQGFVEYGRIVIENDVWIGAGVSIADNVTIGNGAILATGAVVTKDVEPYSIVGGVPAKLIRKRFSEQEIDLLLGSKWWELDDKVLAENHQAFHHLSGFAEFWKTRRHNPQP